MEIELLTFGIIRELLGSPSIRLDVNDRTTVGSLRAILRDKHPEIREVTSFAVALNGSYATDEMTIESADEIAVIPPVSGG